MRIPRREFLTTLLAGGATLLPRRSSFATPRATDSKIEILIKEPIGTIAPELYGHFAEHLGGVIYDGIWVGEGSSIPNIGGIRTELINRLKSIKPPVIRWPGGCFADSYNWRDGIGRRSERPRRTNFWADNRSGPYAKVAGGPQKFEPNHFGTLEFLRFCRLVGATPYLAANVRSSSPRDFTDWVEYCNAPAGSTTLAGVRAAGGEKDPFGVRYWGVGNEPWGCGGNFTPEEYATEFRRFTAWVPRYGAPLSLIAAGPNGGDSNWTTGFFRKLTERGKGLLDRVFGWALHYYCGSTGARNSTAFTTKEWYELLLKASRMESLITQHWAAMAEVDTAHKVKLIVDEWGAWHAQGPEVPPSYLWGYAGSMRDALVAALTLDTFNRHADKLAMANVAQLINTIHSLFLAYEDKLIVTPNFHVFEMYAAHQGGRSLRTVVSAPGIAVEGAEKPQTLEGLAGSASLHDKELVVSVVNSHVSDARECEIVVHGATIRDAHSRVLSSPDLTAHNSFETPEAVKPQERALALGNGDLVCRFVPASVTLLRLTLE